MCPDYSVFFSRERTWVFFKSNLKFEAQISWIHSNFKWTIFQQFSMMLKSELQEAHGRTLLCLLSCCTFWIIWNVVIFIQQRNLYMMVVNCTQIDYHWKSKLLAKFKHFKVSTPKVIAVVNYATHQNVISQLLSHTIFKGISGQIRNYSIGLFVKQYVYHESLLH